MKALLLKDLYMLKTHFLILIGISAAALILSFVTNIGAGLAFPITFIAVMKVGNLMMLDSHFKWERTATILPVKTTEIILSKYILLAFTAIFPATTSVLAIYISVQDTPDFILPLWSLIVGSILGMASILSPTTIFFGEARGRLVMVLIILIPWLLGIKLIDEPTVTKFLTNPGEFISYMYLYLGCAILLFIISFFISVNIYKKKDW